jgi:hypothetical protein
MTSGSCLGHAVVIAAFPQGCPIAGFFMSLATFNAETASGEGAHGPDKSRHAK